MNALVLPAYPPTSKLEASIVVMLLWLVSFRLADAFRFHVGLRETGIGVLISCFLYYVLRHTIRSVSITKESKSVDWSFLGYLLTTRQFDISGAAWVRAHPEGAEIVIELGSSGYATTELLRVPKDAIPLAEEWCGRVASYLELSNKGYRRFA